MNKYRSLLAAPILVMALSFAGVTSVKAQTTLVKKLSDDTVLVIPGEIYRAARDQRRLLGDNYRDEWTAAIKVPVLHLATFHGGLTPTKEGGGMQAKNLHLVASDSTEYVFRQVRKTNLILSNQYRHTVVWSVVRDEGSASHPTGALAVPILAEAGGVLHATPHLYYMPDDPRLGEFRKDFAGILGMIEESPDVPKSGHAFADAVEIIDSDKLLDEINKDPDNRVDERALLTARLLDMLIGDNDRHPDNWKWARFNKGDPKIWEPIPSDRDKAFVSYEGLLMKLGRFVFPNLVTFTPDYPAGTALFANAGEFDRRLLASLDKSVWDSTATSLMQRMTDAVIDSAVREMPSEYAKNAREIAATLKARRNGLRDAADRYYKELWRTADVHGTDADDQATITRAGEGIVDVTLQSGKTSPYFSRRFNLADTKTIRIYLHDGNDRATVQGAVNTSIPIRVIGGNGTNTFVDLSTVGGERNPTRFYDAGTVSGVKYAKDTVDVRRNLDNAFNHDFNRRPWLNIFGTTLPPMQDRGSSVVPYAYIHSDRGLGLYPEIGATRFSYGFRKVPYSSATSGDVSYSPSSNRWRVRTSFDKRFEESPWHAGLKASMSELEIFHFHGFGNDLPDVREPFFDLRQAQWQFAPGIAFSPNLVSDIILGPVVRYTTTDSSTNFISQLHPTGFPTYGQAGLRLRLRLDNKYLNDTTKMRLLLDAVGAAYPGMWDVPTPYESLDAFAAIYFPLPLPKRPQLAFRVGGKKLWGDFPYFDAAFLGGSDSFRSEERQRWAGDASIYAGSELHWPLAQFPFIVPVDFGAMGFTDMGRVYVDGDSPGGLHKVWGGGFWAGLINPRYNFNLLFTNDANHRILYNFNFAY